MEASNGLGIILEKPLLRRELSICVEHDGRAEVLDYGANSVTWEPDNPFSNTSC